MHEYSTAYGIFQAMLEAVSNHEVQRVVSLEIELGLLNHINPEQLAFCFKALAKGSFAENADLNITRKLPNIRCECGYEGIFDAEQYSTPYDLAINLCCPRCGNHGPELLSGREINLRNIRVEANENA